MYEHVDGQLSGRAFLSGDVFTVADIAGCTITSALPAAVREAHPNVAKWFDVVGARPGVRRGMAAFR